MTAPAQNKNVFNYNKPDSIKLRRPPTGRLEKLHTTVGHIDASSKGKVQKIETQYMSENGQEFLRIKHYEQGIGSAAKLTKTETEWYFTNPSGKWLADERPK